ncbi:coproporphyrinogen III oxidase [Clostridium rectalis]|uniref:coproporphyrinogen III oxidase n=1 Tax=Clostridium rectalis TaxID=2040295 RepID=UPI000F635012|nr:coproporphyrinogen III oxidase [Clostridium rectalis]
MTINIKLKNINYRYEIYQMFNLFYPLSEINFNNVNYNYKISLEKNGIIIEDEFLKEEYINDKNINEKGNLKKSIYSFLNKKTGKIFPWGTLVGIRPSKIALSMLIKGKSEEEIVDYFTRNYFTDKEKAKLCIRIAKMEIKMVNKDKNKISLYIGMPFCPTRCLYCSFASNPITKCKKMVQPYLRSLVEEFEGISKYIEKKGLKVQTVYFGGGTPTSVNDEEFEYIMKKIYNKFIYGNNIEEFTVECGRPDSLSYKKFKVMKRYKVDRISINPQTMNDDTLKLVGRNHTVKDVIEKYNMARKLGFNNINMDIIVGLPKEGLTHVKNTCREILKLNPDSITVHGMSIKRGSDLYKKLELTHTNHNELMEMYKETVKLAEDLLMEPYYMYRQKNMKGNMENIGYSHKNKHCIYNIQMIEEKQTIIAMGADAVSKVVFLDENRLERVPNVKDVIEYNKRVDEMIKRKIEALEELYN